MEKNVTLKLSTNESKVLIDGFMDSPFINCLTLQGNKLTEISPGAFKLLPNLYFLNLAENSLSNFITFDSHLQLKTLIIDENKVKISHLSLKSKFPKLQHVYLRKNGIVNITREFGENLPNLTHLYLSDNLVEKIENFPRKLKNLFLDGNKLVKFNATSIENIETLVLDRNFLQIICNTYCHENSLSLNNVKYLKNLSISENNVNDLEPDSFDDILRLENLDLSKNKLELIRKGTFNSLRKLKKLSLNNNKLQTLPNLSSLENIETLNIDFNRIEKISAGEFKNFPYLTTLSLRGNLLKTIEIDSFCNLMALENLDLSLNKLEHLPINWLTGVENLETLDLSGNCFQNFSSLSLGFMDSLRIILLKNNPIKFLTTKTMMANFPKTVTIFLENKYETKCPNNTKIQELNVAGNSFRKMEKIPFVKKIE